MADSALPSSADDSKFYVYLYRDPRPGREMTPIYVGKGQAANDRANVHWRQRSHNQSLNRVLNKIRKLDLVPVIEIVGRFQSEQDAFQCEIELISKFGRQTDRSGTLCNVALGGEGAVGVVHSALARKNMSDAAKQRPSRGSPTAETIEKRRAKTKGRSRPPEHLAAARAARLGSKASPETREKLRNAHLGKTFSPETRAKLSARAKEQWERQRVKRRELASS
ncbi:hypothetical protein BH10PSE14_BH10PSE14_06670 [soil metagenome]